MVDEAVMPSELPADPPLIMPPALAEALTSLFEDYSDARTDYGPPPTRADIATPEAAAARAFELVRAYAETPAP